MVVWNLNGWRGQKLEKVPMSLMNGPIFLAFFEVENTENVYDGHRLGFVQKLGSEQQNSQLLSALFYTSNLE